VAGHPPAGLDAETKTLAASERDEAARTAWREAVAQLDPEQFVFVDASGTNIALTRLYGWAPHDQRASGPVPRNHGKNTTLVAALAPDGLHVPWMIEGAMDTATFAWYITAQLAPTLRPGQVVVLDNVSVHKAASIRQALEARHGQLLFLPPLYRRVLYRRVLTDLASRIRGAEAGATRWGDWGKAVPPLRCDRFE
jgi:hypothetical protein